MPSLIKFVKAVILALIAVLVIHSGVGWARGRFTKQQLVGLHPSEIEELVVFDEHNVWGQGLKLTDEEAIGQFLKSLSGMVEYQNGLKGMPLD